MKILKTTKVGVPVFSVGNISVGGVGKTPFVELLAEQLRDAGRKVAVISRGYGRKSKGYLVVSDGTQRCAESWHAGDEASQMADKLDKVVIVVDESRVRGAKKVIHPFKVNTILLDDGFQHRYLHRDLDIVMMTAEEILKGEWLLPAGNRREPKSALKRSHLIVVSQCANVSEFNHVKSKVERFNKPIIGVRIKLKSIKRASTNQLLELGNIAKKKFVAFSGIGNPESFEEVLKKTDATMVKHVVFPDHHWYSDNDIQAIIKVRKELDADFLITTEKDMTRLEKRFSKFLEIEPVYFTEIQQEVLVGEEKLQDLLKQVIR